MAEARSAVSEPRVNDFDEGKSATWDFIRAWRKSFFRRFYRTRNLIYNGLWPTSAWNLAGAVSVFSVLLYEDWAWARPVTKQLWKVGRVMHITPLEPAGLPRSLRVFVVSSVGGLTFFVILMYKRRWLLRILLSYRGWMYEQPKQMGWRSKAWGVLVHIISGYHPTTFSYQKSLPFLPVPPLTDTVDRFIDSIEPLYDPEGDDFKKINTQAQEFKTSLGPKLQKILFLKSWWAQNWVTDWWEKYVYLMGRTPIAINSNYYVLDQSYWKPTNRQISRAASIVHHTLVVKRQIDREELPPLVIRGVIPLCMAQYERVFSSTRIPGEECDELKRFDSAVSKHIAVMRKGLYYKVDVYDKKGNILTPQTLEEVLEFIIEDADKHEASYNKGSKSLAALTATDRTTWAQARNQYFASGINKDSLDVLESAIFHMVLETRSYNTFNERGKFMLHGDGKSIWFDKSVNLVIFGDAKLGINAEHSWGDAPVVGYCMEWVLTKEVLCDLFDEHGRCQVVTDYKQADFTRPERLVWDVPGELEIKLDKVLISNIKNNDDLDLIIVDHMNYGKGFIKTCKVSPDAYFQCALQLAYFKDAGKFALTYEASMTRLYLMGRTETVRSLTSDTAKFVRAMINPDKSKEEKIDLLRKACGVHQILYRDAMSGKGIDRHLFGLYVACKGLGQESEFLKSALMMPWTLSTSQQPQQQIAEAPNCSLPEYRDKVSPGGGFGPVSDVGYGVSYMFAGEFRIFIHVSSKHSASNTSSQRFVNNLYESLDEMKRLFSPPEPENIS